MKITAKEGAYSSVVGGGGTGTANMVSKAKAAGIEVLEIDP